MTIGFNAIVGPNDTGGGSSGRPLLTANTTYYVRTDGSDSNNGLTNSAGGAFLTMVHALAVAGSVDTGIYQLTIAPQTGTFDGHLILPLMVGALPPIIQGVNTAAVLTYSSGTTNDATIQSDGSTPWIVKDVKVTASGSTSYSLAANLGAAISFSGVEFGTSSGYHMIAQADGSLKAIGNWTITGGGGAHLIAFGGVISLRTFTCTVSGTPAFSSAFAVGVGPSLIDVFTANFVGSATGQRYNLSNGASTFGTGAATTFFPGNANGSATTGYYG